MHISHVHLVGYINVLSDIHSSLHTQFDLPSLFVLNKLNHPASEGELLTIKTRGGSCEPSSDKQHVSNALFPQLFPMKFHLIKTIINPQNSPIYFTCCSSASP